MHAFCYVMLTFVFLYNLTTRVTVYVVYVHTYLNYRKDIFKEVVFWGGLVATGVGQD